MAASALEPVLRSRRGRRRSPETPMSKKINVGIIGSQFISHIHTLSLKRCAQAEVFAVASPTPGHARTFAAKHEIQHHFTDYKELLAAPEVDMLIVGAPNDVHGSITLDPAAA